MKKFPIGLVALTIALVSCERGPDTSNTTSEATGEASAAVAASDLAKGEGAAAAAETAADEAKGNAGEVNIDDVVATLSESTGVTDCDNDFKKVLACIDDKLPEADRANAIMNLALMRKVMASGSGDKSNKAAFCKALMDQTKNQLSTSGCRF